MHINYIEVFELYTQRANDITFPSIGFLSYDNKRNWFRFGFSVFLWMHKSNTFHYSLKRSPSNHFALMVFGSIQIYALKSSKSGGEAHKVRVNLWLTYSKGVTLLTCSWRFFKSATALGRSASSTSYRSGSKEKPFFHRFMRWKSPHFPSDTTDFRPPHSCSLAASPPSAPAPQR